MNLQIVNLVSFANASILVIFSINLWQKLEADHHKAAIFYDVSLYLGIMAICWFSCVPATEAGTDLVKDLKAARKADSVLNRELIIFTHGSLCCFFFFF